MTTLRKVVTICLSFLLFSKPFSVDYVYAGVLILIAIYLNIYRLVLYALLCFYQIIFSKNKAKWDAALNMWVRNKIDSRRKADSNTDYLIV